MAEAAVQQTSEVPPADNVPQEAAPGQKQDNQAEAIKFIKEKLQSSFDEQNAKQLFEFYTLDKETQRLQPPDVRKLLLDLLAASEWPLVVPDESLDAVLHELCLNDEGSISWIEFKSFFVFLQDAPLKKLFDLITKEFTKQQLAVARLIVIKPVRKDKPKPLADDQAANGDVDGDEKKDDDISQREKSYYDRNKWNMAVQEFGEEYKQIYIYFMDGWQILALAIGGFDKPLEQPQAAELKVNDTSYLATIRAFDVNNDMFPPITRSGGVKSKVARKMADSYIIARQWDENHLQIVDKTGKLAHSVSVKWTQFDERFKVNERINATTNSIINSVKGFDEKHQLTRRLSAGAKSFDEKFGISSKFASLAEKVRSNEKVQNVSQKVSESFNAAVKTVDDIGAETQQLVQEKRQQQSQGVAVQSNEVEIEEGGGAQNVEVQQYGVNEADTAPVQVEPQ